MNKQNFEINQFINYYIITKSNKIENSNGLKIGTKSDRNKVFCDILNDKNKTIEFAKNIENIKIDTLMNIFYESIISNPSLRSIDSITTLYSLIQNEDIKKTLLHAMLQRDSKALICLYNKNAIDESNCIKELENLNDNYSNIYFTAVFNKRCGEIIINASVIDIIYDVEHKLKKCICQIIYNHIDNKEGLIDVLKEGMEYSINAKSIIINNFSFFCDKIISLKEIEPVMDNYNIIVSYLEKDNFESAKAVFNNLDIKTVALIINSIYSDKGLEIVFDKIKASDIDNYENDLAQSLANQIRFSCNDDVILNSIDLITSFDSKLNDISKKEVCKIIDIDLENLEQTTGKKLIDLVKSVITVTDEYNLINNFDRLQDISKYNLRLLIVAAMAYKTGTYRIFLEYLDNDEQSERLEAECKFLLNKKFIPTTVNDLDNDRFKEIIISYFNNNDYGRVLKNKPKKIAINAAFTEWCKDLNESQLKYFISNGSKIIDCLNDESLEILKCKINENINSMNLNDEMLEVFSNMKLDFISLYNQLSSIDKEKALQYYKTHNVEIYNKINDTALNKSNKENLSKYLKEFDFENVLKYKEEEDYSNVVGDWIKSLPSDDIIEIIINNISFIEKQSTANINNLLSRIYEHYVNKSIDDERILDNLLLIGADSLKLYEVMNERGKLIILQYLINHRPGIAEKIYKEKIINSQSLNELDSLIGNDFNNISNENIIIILKMKAYSFIEVWIVNLSSLDKNFISESNDIAESLCKYQLEKRFYYDNLLMESADKRVLESIKKQILKTSKDFKVIESYIDSLDILLGNENYQGFEAEFENIIDVILANDYYIKPFTDKLKKKEYKKEVLYFVLNKFSKAIVDNNSLVRQSKGELKNIEFKTREVIAESIKKPITGLEKAISREDINVYSKENLSKHIKQLRISLNNIGIETVEDVDLYLKKVKFDPGLHQNNNLDEGTLETLGLKVNDNIVEYCLLKEEN